MIIQVLGGVIMLLLNQITINNLGKEFMFVENLRNQKITTFSFK